MEFRIVGLPEGVTRRDYPVVGPDKSNVLKDNLMRTLFTADVLQYRIGHEWYEFSESTFGGSYSETLPSIGTGTFDGWDIASLGPYDFKGPNSHVDAYPLNVYITSRSQKQQNDDDITLSYRWDDGLEAESELQIAFVDQFANPFPVMGEVVHQNTPQPYVFPGLLELGSKEWEDWNDGKEKDVRFKPLGAAYKVASTVVNVAAAVTAVVIPETGVPGYIALAAVGMSLGEPEEATKPLTPAKPFETDTAKIKRVYQFTAAVQTFLQGKSTEYKMAYLADKLKWKAEYLPQMTVEVFRWDEFGPEGFVRQVIRVDEYPLQNHVDAEAKRFTYYATTAGGF